MADLFLSVLAGFAAWRENGLSFPKISGLLQISHAKAQRIAMKRLCVA